jgi:hypothetical protein
MYYFNICLYINTFLYISAYIANVRIVDPPDASKSIHKLLHTVEPNKLGLDLIQYEDSRNEKNKYVEQNTWKLDDLYKAYVWTASGGSHTTEDGVSFVLEWYYPEVEEDKQIVQGFLLGVLENSTQPEYNYVFNLRRLVLHPNLYAGTNGEINNVNVTKDLMTECYRFASEMNSTIITKNLNQRVLVELAYLRTLEK